MPMNPQIGDFITQTLLGGAEVEDTEDLLLSGQIDSLGVMRLVAFIEQTLSITVPPEDVVIEHFQSLAAIEAYLETRTMR
ncbi:MAG: acyl carrier protein [Pseudomonadota bacterium]